MDEIGRLQHRLADTPLRDWLAGLPEQIEARLNPDRHGDLHTWLEALDRLPDITASGHALDSARIRVGAAADLGADSGQLKQTLMHLHPWRKGPFSLFGLPIDSEWRSDWKWQRLARHIQPLSDRVVLDVGCGNGYHSWRMAGAGARQVIGIDPELRFLCQFQVFKRYLPEAPVSLLPLGVEELPPQLRAFDSVFSMGVLYHRRSPLDHLIELRDLLRPGGELIIETLVIEGDATAVLMPAGRYARMRNVWFLPSVKALTVWLQRLGLRQVRCVDISRTTIEEQHSTDWMQFDSLPDFLDPEDHRRTIEGYPSPQRAILLAEAA